jgi:exonuclease III
MRVVSWNMAYWSAPKAHDGAWRWIFDELRPDILFFQEAVPPEWVKAEREVVWAPAYPGGKQPWGTGIVSRLPLHPARVPPLDEWFRNLPAGNSGKGRPSIHGADGWLTTARVSVPVLGSVLVASVHSPSFPIEKGRLHGIDVTGMKLKRNPDLWFLDVLFFFLRSMLGSRLLVGGDFNASRLLDKTLGERGNNEFFDRIKDEGFVSLHRLFHDADERTFFQKGKGPHQLDYIYADQPVAEFARACSVHDVQPCSDHAAL